MANEVKLSPVTVKATRPGYYGLRRRKVGEVFLCRPHEFSESWMQLLKGKLPAPGSGQAPKAPVSREQTPFIQAATFEKPKAPVAPQAESQEPKNLVEIDGVMTEEISEPVALEDEPLAEIPQDVVSSGDKDVL